MSALLLAAILIGFGIAVILVVFWSRSWGKRPEAEDSSAMTELISDEDTQEIRPPTPQASPTPPPGAPSSPPPSREMELAGCEVVEYEPLEEEAFSSARLLEEGETPPQKQKEPPPLPRVSQPRPVQTPDAQTALLDLEVLGRPAAMVTDLSLQGPPILDVWPSPGNVAGDTAEGSSDPMSRLPEDFYGRLEEVLLSVEEEERKGATIPQETRYALGVLAYRGQKADLAIGQAKMALESEGGRARALNLMALAYHHQGFAKEAEGRLQEAVALSEDDSEAKAAVFTNLALLSTYKRSTEEALRYYGEALEVHRGREDLQGAGEILSRMGRLCRTKGALSEAAEHHREALEMCRQGPDRGRQALELRLLATVLRDQGELKAALGFSQEALSLSRELRDRREEAINLGNIGLLFALEKDFAQSKEHYEVALSLHRETGNRRGEANSLGNLANVLFQTGEPEQALQAYEKAYEINREIGYQWGQAANGASLGTVYAELGEVDKALSHFHEALRLFGELNAENQRTALEATIKQLERQRLESTEGAGS